MSEYAKKWDSEIFMRALRALFAKFRKNDFLSFFNFFARSARKKLGAYRNMSQISEIFLF